MTDQILTALGWGAFFVLICALCTKFHRVRNFNAVAIATIFTVLLKIMQAWLVLFLVWRQHLPTAAGQVIESRLETAFLALSSFAYAIAVYYLGGKPKAGFWKWIVSDQDADQVEGAGVKA